ncbi:MAG TPA: hypothetical protein VIK91_16825, partial [Nannocystis sp.]
MRPAHRTLLALAGLAALGVLFFLTRPSQPDPDPPLAWAVCAGLADDLDLVATGELRLHRDLLPPGGLTPEFVRDAVALQLRQAFAGSHNDPHARITLTPDGPPHTVELLATAEVAYGLDITLDWPNDPELRPESAYVRRALERGRLAAGDPALAVRWCAPLRAARCARDSAHSNLDTLPVPHDPYLLYWTIDAAERIEHTYHGKRVVSFPCAASDIADYAHPEYLWYFWQPRDCPQFQNSPHKLGEITLQIVRTRPPSGDLKSWRDRLAAAIHGRPLRIALVFGYLNHHVPRPDLAAVRAALRSGTSDRPFEWGTHEFLRFVAQRHELLASHTLTVPDDGPDPTAEIRGILRRSGRPVELAVTLTDADYLAPASYPARHAPLLLAALRDADAILYAGHSGLGHNFSRLRLEEHAGADRVAEVLAASPTRLIAFIGCYTYSYFGDDFAPHLPRAAPR